MEKKFRILDPIKKIRRKHKVELSQDGQMQSVPAPKTNAFSDPAGGGQSPDRARQPSFLLQAKGKEAVGGQFRGGGDECFGEIDTDNLRNLSGEFERSTTHGATEIQSPPGPDFSSSGFRKKQRGTSCGEIANPIRHRATLGKQGLGMEVMKRKILRENGGGFVSGFQARSCSR